MVETTARYKPIKEQINYKYKRILAFQKGSVKDLTWEWFNVYGQNLPTNNFDVYPSCCTPYNIIPQVLKSTLSINCVYPSNFTSSKYSSKYWTMDKSGQLNEENRDGYQYLITLGVASGMYTLEGFFNFLIFNLQN